MTIAETLSILTSNSELSNLLEKDKFEIISAKTFKAVGDDVADDSDAVLAGLAYIQANGLGSYYFPHGIYKVDPARFDSNTFDGIYLWGDNSSFDGISDTIYQVGVAVVTPDSVLTTSILNKAVTSPKFADDVQVGSLTLLNALITGAARASVTAAINKVIDIISADIIATQTGAYTYAATSAGNDTYVVTLSPEPPDYAVGMALNIKVDVGNTGSATLNANSKGAVTLAKMTSAGVSALVTGDMIAGGVYAVIVTVISSTPYFLVLNPTGLFDGVGLGTAYQGLRMKSDETGSEFGNVMIGEKQVYTSGTNTFTAPKTGIYKVTVVGGGGGSGFSGVASGAVNPNGGGQGGAGGVSIGYTTLTKGSTYSAVVGTGGAQGTGANGPSDAECYGHAGSSSSFNGISGTGGGGGSSAFSAFGAGGSGGSGSGGDLNLTSDDGATTYPASGLLYRMGSGKSIFHPYGFGGRPNADGTAGIIFIEW